MLVGAKVVLRAWRESDVQTLLELRNDVALQAQLMSQAKPNSVEGVRRWLIDKSNRDDAVFFVIAAGSDQAAVGYVQVVNVRPVHGTGELGICIAPSRHRRGLGSDTLITLEPYLRETLGLRKVLLYVLADNAKAIALYRKCQYREVGSLRRHFFSAGEYRDVVIMEKNLAT